MLELIIPMLERIGIIVTVAFVLTRLRFFRENIHENKIQRSDYIKVILFFGLFGIIGTYTGLTFNTESLQIERWPNEIQQNEAIANSRVIGIVIAGMLGGYKVGIGAGAIAGIHRFMLGGFTDLACGLSAVTAGIIGGAFRKMYFRNTSNIWIVFFVGAFAEFVQMATILLIARPFSSAILLVNSIGLPMIMVNGIGAALFLLIIRNVLFEEEKAGALQAQKALRLADLTLAHMRKGLHRQSAEAVCEILYKEVGAIAIAMTDKKKILAHVGVADDHHISDADIQTKVTKQVLFTGQLLVTSQNHIHCQQKDCPLKAVVVAPLILRGEAVGTLKFYFDSEKAITKVVMQLINGLSKLLSNQLEIAEADKAFQLAKEAEIKALQAQISPHFLFNSLNVISSLIRTDQHKARKLLISLSHFFRQNLAGTTQEWTTLDQELKHVQAYLNIEQARFVDKLEIQYDIDEKTLLCKVPPLTLQPLVENAIKHGIKEKEKDCYVRIEIKMEQGYVRVAVIDNGKGIAEQHVHQLGKEMMQSTGEGTGLGLYNVNRRLTMLLGEQAKLYITSKPYKETSVSFYVPSGG
ncbi:sensor histidine kinase [Bacillus sp. HMF5848]|uniref:sensor histidine kinase n=1 Tax=Bacillus sp. HMF5848 TaxID=2495421 RepID=UPI000F7A08E8|nr:sensor histidine kinase [Bacillus sp. HMF5848]RSK25656.1 sensor histidine kinase [Bacillus sp. HMF5848]